jgi:KTSC domain-containing protein
MPSSVIRYFKHDPESGELLVVFQTGKRYRYHAVSAEIAEGMRRAFSKGEYFNEHIRDRFAFERLDAAE